MTPTALPSVTPTEVACVTIDNVSGLAQLDGRALEQRVFVVNSAKKANKLGYLSKKELTKYVTEAKNGYVVAWTAVWTIPSFVKDCPETPACVKVSLQGVIQSFVDKSDILKQLANKLAAKVKSKGDKHFAQSIAKKAKALHDQNVKETEKLPSSVSQCTT